VGVFAPIASAPLIGSVNYFGVANRDGVLIFLLSIAALILSLKKKYKPLLAAGGLSLALLLLTLTRAVLGLRGTPSNFQVQWGWAILVIGSGLLILSAVRTDMGTVETFLFIGKVKRILFVLWKLKFRIVASALVTLIVITIGAFVSRNWLTEDEAKNTIARSEAVSEGAHAELGPTHTEHLAVAAPRSEMRMRYRVQRGDTIASIARKFDVTAAQIRKWNSIRRVSSTRLRPGRVLIIYGRSRRLQSSDQSDLASTGASVADGAVTVSGGSSANNAIRFLSDDGDATTESASSDESHPAIEGGSQLVVGGRVTVRGESTPIADALITLFQGDKHLGSTFSDSQGRFEFPELLITPGRYGFYVKSKGFQTVDQDIELTGERPKLSIGLLRE
jgi:LysM repeat protein